MPTLDAIQINDTVIKQDGSQFSLWYNDTRYMCENIDTMESLKELQSQIDIAKGHVICTGLGFLLREEKLLEKEEVDCVVVIEKNKDVIDIQRKLNPAIMDKLFIINDDANLYEGKCDTLLIDHFEDYEDNKLPIVANCCKNIQHKQMLYWDIFADYTRYNQYQELRKQFVTLPNFTSSQFYNYVEDR